MAASRVKKKAPFPTSAECLCTASSKEKFEDARRRVVSDGARGIGIGGLGEKYMHRTVKYYIDPNEENHEISHLGMVADIKNADGVFEVQTRSYDKLKTKLGRMLPHGMVTVVCPLSYEKTVRWMDIDSGEISKERKSPKRECIYDALYHLYSIREYITDPNLRVKLLFFKSGEIRALNGWDIAKKRGSTRVERIPEDILFEINISSPENYALFIPQELGDSFAASELARAIARSSRFTFYVLKLLLATGVICECGKRGRAVLYCRTAGLKCENS